MDLSLLDRYGDIFYIASQSKDFGGSGRSILEDEVQRCFAATELEIPIVCEGEPGVGKNQLTYFFANALHPTVDDGRPERVNCTQDMLWNDIVGDMTQELGKDEDGNIIAASHTPFKPKQVVIAMRKGKLLVIDEPNQLEDGIQIGLNPLLEQGVRVLEVDGKLESAQKGFQVMLLYNQGEGENKTDLKYSTRTRCEYIKFNPFNTDLQARIALIKSGLVRPTDLIDRSMEIRAIGISEDASGRIESYMPLKARDNEFVNFYTDVPVDGLRVVPYLMYKGLPNASFLHVDPEINRFYVIASGFVKFCETARSLINYGTGKLSQNIQNALSSNTDLQSGLVNLGIRPPSPRQVIFAMQKYKRLEEKGASIDFIFPNITKGIIENICAGGKGDESLGSKNGLNVTFEQTLYRIASLHSIHLGGHEYHLVPQEMFASLNDISH